MFFGNKKKYNLSKVILIILDGFGLGPPGPGNPITAKNMPYLNGLIGSYASKSLAASGLIVGLDWGIYGNSEVGHSALGTGRVIVQSLARINIEIKNGKFFKNSTFLEILEHVKKNASRVHLIGCVSPGGIHSHENHLIGLLEFFAKNKFEKVTVHMITDGEDSGPTESLVSLKRISSSLKSSGAEIASVGGRNFAMDRVKNWPLIKKAWDVMVHGKNLENKTAREYIEANHKKEIFDAEIEPASLPGTDGKSIKIEDNDAIIFFNYRNDRMKQIVSSFITHGFDGFDRGRVPANLAVATMTDYDDKFKVAVAYPPPVVPDTLGEIISKNNFRQLRLAESEKEAHVTNFFNGEKLDAYPKEERLIAPSRSGLDYIAHPEMSIEKITKNIEDNLDKPYKLYIVNFANSDMVAHTGNIKAAVGALQAVDKSLEKIISSVDLKKVAVVITADHGNAEEMIDPDTKKPDTQHSTANVPLILVNDNFKKQSGENLENLFRQKEAGSLIDVAPTVLALLDLKQPRGMTGSPLLK
jgi:2,3-bisphosphoglycerate-independent phosphoglycerate mutase